MQKSINKAKSHLRVPYPSIANRFGTEEIQAILEVLQSDTLSIGVTAGPVVEKFQKEFAEFIGTKYAFAVSNGTVTLELATELLGIGPGDEVIVPAITFIATALPILRAGGKVVFADLDYDTLNLTAESIKEKITSRTKAIYLVHHSGLPVNMEPIMKLARKHNIAVVEDCAHTTGARYKGKRVGSMGDYGSFSFHTIKNLTTGEGGMITTNDPKAAYDIPRLRWLGTTLYEKQEDFWRPFLYDIHKVRGVVGHNFCMSEIAAAIGRVQLKKIDKMNKERRKLAHMFNERLKGIKEIKVPTELPDRDHVYHHYQLLFDGSSFGANVNDLIRISYYDFGVQIVPHYLPVYWFSLFKELGHKKGECPVAEKIYSQLATLPFSLTITEKEIDYMAEVLTKTVKKLKAKYRKR